MANQTQTKRNGTKMKKLLTTVALAATLLTGMVVAHADDYTLELDNNSLALGLSNIIGSKEACGLTLNRAAIQQFIKEHVDASDMSFPDDLRTDTIATRNNLKQMSPSDLSDYCLTARMIAEHYGFTNGSNQ
jgi:hypothetical protein